MDGSVHSSDFLIALTHPHSPTGTESSTEIGHHDFAVHEDISCYKQRSEKFILTLPTYLLTYSLCTLTVRSKVRSAYVVIEMSSLHVLDFHLHF